MHLRSIFFFFAFVLLLVPHDINIVQCHQNQTEGECALAFRDSYYLDETILLNSVEVEKVTSYSYPPQFIETFHALASPKSFDSLLYPAEFSFMLKMIYLLKLAAYVEPDGRNATFNLQSILFSIRPEIILKLIRQRRAIRESTKISDQSVNNLNYLPQPILLSSPFPLQFRMDHGDRDELQRIIEMVLDRVMNLLINPNTYIPYHSH